MKKTFFFVVLLLAFILAGWRLNAIRQVNQTNEGVGGYGIGEQSNKAKTGSAVCFDLGSDDSWYLFAKDFKRNSTHPQFLCYMNYSSTQGSYQAKWSKDGQMIGVYDEPSYEFSKLIWIIGYDWKKGRVLHCNELAQQFKNHGGIGAYFIYPQPRKPTPQELKQFQPETLSRDKRRP